MRAASSSLRRQLLQCCDAFRRAGMGGQEPALAAAGLRDEPSERVDHLLSRMPGALEDLSAMAIGRVLFLTAVDPREQLARDRGDRAAARNDLVEDDRADAQAGAERLRLRDVVQVVMGELVREHAAKLVVVRLLKQAGGQEELPAPGVGGVDRRIVHDADLHLARVEGLVHPLEQRNHHPLQALDLRGIQFRGRFRPRARCRGGGAAR